jgi:4-diphosphocytidyl-2-C-methyl-D-erythritol kinase
VVTKIKAMITFPNAKINIGLQIVEKRPDGYHNIESCFYPVGWSDVLEILPADTLQFTSSGIDIPGNTQHNLCLKAYQLLKQDFDIPAVHIHLHKVIPIGAGLGGGSADGAFTIKMLNDLFDLRLSIEKMKKYARQLGSDCAFFIENKPVYCLEKGDIFEPIVLDLTGKYITLVNPNIHISTAEAYNGISPHKPQISLRASLSKPIANWQDEVLNDFEQKLLYTYPTIREIKEKLYRLGASYSSMTGSGSTVYAISEQALTLDSTFENYIIWHGKC